MRSSSLSMIIALDERARRSARRFSSISLGVEGPSLVSIWEWLAELMTEPGVGGGPPVDLRDSRLEAWSWNRLLLGGAEVLSDPAPAASSPGVSSRRIFCGSCELVLRDTASSPSGRFGSTPASDVRDLLRDLLRRKSAFGELVAPSQKLSNFCMPLLAFIGLPWDSSKDRGWPAGAASTVCGRCGSGDAPPPPPLASAASSSNISAKSASCCFANASPSTKLWRWGAAPGSGARGLG
mmetsp:Transcript_43983/g.84017  ORF Transcript_43983/g.84017 Transcript_43983/m.84017 type:complete len:238 (-) Transcript_43983:903-1616(-)